MKRCARFRELVAYLVEDTPCVLDHHGYCQEHHGGFRVGGCWNTAAREALGMKPLTPR